MTISSLEKRLARIEEDRAPIPVRFLLIRPGGPDAEQLAEVRRLEASGVDVRLVRDPFAGTRGAP